MSKLKLTDRDWKGFAVEDIFNIHTGKDLILSKVEEGHIPIVSHSEINNGIQVFSKNISKHKIFDSNTTISLADRGTFKSFVQPYDFYIGTRVKGLEIKNDVSKNVLKFLTACIDKQSILFSYGRNACQRLNKTKIMLPENSDGLPDWQFMEDFIKQKEQKQIADLKDYYANKAVELMISTGSLKNTEWREFSFSDIFIEVKRGKRLTKGNQQSGETPYVSSTAANNGVDNFIGNSKGVRTFENCLTLANSGSVGSTFFHHYTFVASDHVTALILEKPNKYIYLFLSGIIKRLEEKYSFNREINDKRIQREKILLPVNSDGLPDWQFMESFMKQIERDKIDSVLNYYNNSLNNNNLRGGRALHSV